MASQVVNLTCYANPSYSDISKILNLHKNLISYATKSESLPSRAGSGVRSISSYQNCCESAHNIIYPYVVAQFTISERSTNIEVISSDNK